MALQPAAVPESAQVMEASIALALEASIDGVLAPVGCLGVEAGRAALWAAADREDIWLDSYPATVEVLTAPSWHAKIQSIVIRDGRWSAPLLLGDSYRETTMRLQVVDQGAR
ncbi:hypothetical protein [Kitasatospora sp. MBT63]|uniref:hypothetical protein n=1 Tax=Kitasatospora sp. MBT63 TaxID=1444768 RepID=UPI0011EA66E6|nr:hypothetical protein [Kitasatospora sp. MBT63]